MLIRFKVSNFLSFNQEQELSMIAGATKKKEEHILNNNDLKLLKFSAIYGANASGKSNLLRAINFARNVILKGISSNNASRYCRIRNENKDKISSFDFEIEINNKFYTYGFDILLSQNSIRAEWLYELDKNKNKEVLIFNRKLNEDININKEYFSNDEDILSRLNVYYSDMKEQDNILFLTIMNKDKDTLYRDNVDNNVVIFRDIYNWFGDSLTIIFPQVGLDNSSFFTSQEDVEKINELVSKFGTGISECKFIDGNIQELQAAIPPNVFRDMLRTFENKILNEKKEERTQIQATVRVGREMYIIQLAPENELIVKKLVLKHKNDDSEYSFSEESDGTQRLFDLIEILMNKGTKKIYVIDELDRCLHPELTYEFIARFLNMRDNNSQLIVTTHESRLLDFDLLRRDEIWFANREKNGPTELYSLERYNERFDRKIDKAYLEGRYGGVPIFETLFPVGGTEDERN